jgi:hypothetical protein
MLGNSALVERLAASQGLGSLELVNGSVTFKLILVLN